MHGVTRDYVRSLTVVLPKVSVSLLVPFPDMKSAGVIYDGTFSKTKIPGDGKAAALLKANGIRVYTELELEEFWSQE